MQLLSSMLVSLFYIPIIILFVLLIHYRQKFKAIDIFMRKLPLKVNRLSEKWIIYVGSAIFALVWGSIVASIVLPSSDVVQAMTSGINAFFIGENPFIMNVVPHMISLASGSAIVYGTYNYGPLDLIIYGIGYLIFKGLLGNLWWIVGFNYVLVFVIYAIFRKTFPEIPDLIKFPPFMIIMGCFLQDNVILMIVFLAGAWWAHERLTNHFKDSITILLLSAGVLTKMFIALVLLGYFIFVFQKEIKKWVIYSLQGGSLALLIMIPFNVLAVIHSVFFFNVNLTERAQYATIQGSIPALLQTVGLEDLFILIAFILTGIFVIFAWRYSPDNLYLKIIMLSFLSLLLLPNTVYAFFAIPFYSCLILYCVNYQIDTQEDSEASLKQNSFLKDYLNKLTHNPFWSR